MVTLRQVTQCIRLENSDSFFVVRDFFGYTTGAPNNLSLLAQIRLLQGKYVHLNIIQVGIESFTPTDEQEIDQAIDFTRNNYSQVNLGIGRIERYFIYTADANGMDNINSDNEAEELTNDWTVPNDALDIFFVLTYAGPTIGRSRVDGPCNKDAKGMNGSVVAIEGIANITGLVLAHEVGHYLGLSHVDSSTNLMFPSVPNGGTLTVNQGLDMKDHCFVQSEC